MQTIENRVSLVDLILDGNAPEPDYPSARYVLGCFYELELQQVQQPYHSNTPMRVGWLKRADNVLAYIFKYFEPKLGMVLLTIAIAMRKLPFDTVRMPTFNTIASAYGPEVFHNQIDSLMCQSGLTSFDVVQRADKEIADGAVDYSPIGTDRILLCYDFKSMEEAALFRLFYGGE